MIHDFTLLTILSHRPENFCHVLDVTGIEKEMDRLFEACLREAGAALPYSVQKQTALVTELLEEQINAGANYDAVFCVGPMMMMKFVCKVTEKYNIPTVVSMSPIMVDGTGMCGCCRLTLKEADGTTVTKFACVDGPDFDGFKVDWDESVKRGKMYGEWERHKHEETCNLFKKEVK